MLIYQNNTNQEVNSAKIKQQLFGKLKINYLLYVIIPAIFITPLYSYHMAVSQKQQPPYPHATITNTACHYPQATIFRFVMLSAASFISLIYYVSARWINYQKKRIQYPGPTYTSWLAPLSQISVIGQMMAISTIDTAGYPDVFHSAGAIFFFIVLFIVVILYTRCLKGMHNWNPTVLTRCSLIMKNILTFYVSAVIIYSLIGLAIQVLPKQQSRLKDDDQFVVIMQWNMVEICLLWLLSFIFDWKDLTITIYKSGKIGMTQK